LCWSTRDTVVARHCGGAVADLQLTIQHLQSLCFYQILSLDKILPIQHRLQLERDRQKEKRDGATRRRRVIPKPVIAGGHHLLPHISLYKHPLTNTSVSCQSLFSNRECAKHAWGRKAPYTSAPPPPYRSTQSVAGAISLAHARTLATHNSAPILLFAPTTSILSDYGFQSMLTYDIEVSD